VSVFVSWFLHYSGPVYSWHNCAFPIW
jgi:hypothetical protein